MLRRITSLLVAALLANAVSPALSAGIPGKKAVYRGGTLPLLEVATVGTMATTDVRHFVFRYKSGELRIPYGKVNALEYGQKAGRRLGLAIAFSPFFLLSRKRRHYLTIGYIDVEGNQQAAVFELGKKIVRVTLAGLEARSGLKVEFEDEKARAALNK